MIWPGIGSTPARPQSGAHANIHFPGTRKHGHGLFGPTLSVTVAYLVITLPGGGIGRRERLAGMQFTNVRTWVAGGMQQ